MSVLNAIILLMCSLVLSSISLNAEDAYLAEGQVAWEDVGGDAQAVKIKLVQSESKKKFTITVYMVVDGAEKTYEGAAKGSVQSGTFKADLTLKGNDEETLSLKGNFKSGEFSGKLEKKLGEEEVKGALTWKPTTAFAEPAGGSSKKVANFTIEGNYNWAAQGDNQHNVTAVFNETEPGKYKVDFSFNWGGKDHIYSGTAEGSLSTGKLVGTVTADDQPNRSFGFEGTSNQGAFEGKHHEKMGNNERATGNITWKPKAGSSL